MYNLQSIFPVFSVLICIYPYINLRFRAIFSLCLMGGGCVYKDTGQFRSVHLPDCEQLRKNKLLQSIAISLCYMQLTRVSPLLV